jgi:putative aldouronate transport system permease protein
MSATAQVAKTTTTTRRTVTREQKRSLRAVLRQHWLLYVMLIPSLVALAVFSFYPMWGLSLAFLEYNPFKGLAGSRFVGWENFETLLQSRSTGEILRNTLFIAIGKIILGQVASVSFAVMLNEVRHQLFKRPVQTLTTLPHFLSWVVVGGMMISLLASKSLVNQALKPVVGQPILFLGDPSIFPWTLILSNVWKELGFGSIIYLAALTAISPEIYEAAAVDGANRWDRIRHGTQPHPAPTIILMSCLSLGNVLNAGFEQVLVLYNPLVYSTGDILDTFIYRVGLLQTSYGVATAVGLFKGVIGFILITLSYWLAGKLANYRIL